MTAKIRKARVIENGRCDLMFVAIDDDVALVAPTKTMAITATPAPQIRLQLWKARFMCKYIYTQWYRDDAAD